MGKLPKMIQKLILIFIISVLQIICVCRAGRSGIRSDSDRVFRYRGIEPVWVFLNFRSGSDILSSDSVISDRVRIFRF